jgi:hypothetical protein
VLAEVKIEIGLVRGLLLGVGVQDFEMHGITAAADGREERGRGQVAEEGRGLLAAIVGNAADAAGGDNQ